MKTKMISIDDFKKCVIRIGTVLSAEVVPDADKLLKLSIDVGEENPRQIISGIRGFVAGPEYLVGKQMPVLINLEPRTIRGLESQGMILAASSEGEFSLLFPEKKIKDGAEIR